MPPSAVQPVSIGYRDAWRLTYPVEPTLPRRVTILQSDSGPKRNLNNSGGRFENMEQIGPRSRNKLLKRRTINARATILPIEENTASTRLSLSIISLWEKNVGLVSLTKRKVVAALAVAMK